MCEVYGEAYFSRKYLRIGYFSAKEKVLGVTISKEGHAGILLEHERTHFIERKKVEL